MDWYCFDVIQTISNPVAPSVFNIKSMCRSKVVTYGHNTNILPVHPRPSNINFVSLYQTYILEI